MPDDDELLDAPGEPRDIHSARQFDREMLDELFESARCARSIVEKRGGADLLRHRVVATVFYEPSTRTASSFVAATQRLGGDVVPLLQGGDATSAAKGESLADTVRTLSQYADLLVLRHPEPGSAERAAEAATVPLVNGGDGSREHPTQALLDVFTMVDELGGLDGRRIALAGDLKYGRTVHSLVELLRVFDVSVELVSPPELRLPERYRERLSASGAEVGERTKLGPVLGELDVLYMTRIQAERFDDPAEYRRHADVYTVGPATMDQMPGDSRLMHPLPRVGEIEEAVDDDPRAVYFRQARNGMFVRMALLAGRAPRRGDR